MSSFAYLATGRMIALMQSLSKIRVVCHGQESLPSGSIIFVVNHFTRIETLLLPYHIFTHTKTPVWSLAHSSFFEGSMGSFLGKIGMVSTRDPDRDRLIVKTLLTGEANWIIYPEGRMVKDKEAVVSPSFFGLHLGRQRGAHTGAANLALRTEFYRKRINYLLTENSLEAERLMNMFQIENMMPVLTETTWIVPINLTYYPFRARENVLSTLARRFSDKIPDRLQEELLTEGTMFFEGVNIDIRFGKAIAVAESLTSSLIEQDMFSLQRIDFDDILPSLPRLRREATRLMHRFMTDIYGMTTVNHDHLFASLLKALPLNRISEIDFRRRVFLLTDLVPGKTGIFCHRSLETSQIALLTDDRHHKYREFLELARDTGVVRCAKGVIQRISANLSAESEFSRIRIDNPIGVAANEVQPLSLLKRRVRWLAWMPEILIRSKVVDVLLRQANEQFDADYSEFHRAGESREQTVGAPLLLKGSSQKLGVVLVHGFLAAPLEMLELATYLQKRGFWVYCPRLRGHGTSPEDLATRKCDDWVDSADLGYALMSTICSKVVIGGFSFGGGLALDAAARLTGLAGVFAVSPPFRLQNISSRFAAAATTWNRVMEKIHLHGATKEYVEIFPERPHINYSRVPVAALAEMDHFMNNLRPRLADIKSPTLVVQALGDPVVKAEETKLIFDSIAAGQKKYTTFDFNRHGILAGKDSEKVHGEIAEFIDTL
ncbi:MAG: alpha/beta fold hydrolase [Geobacteraceae bacterium]|nr:alpha/beta fold hydrolase [Geobacteraceae bacterium]